MLLTLKPTGGPASDAPVLCACLCSCCCIYLQPWELTGRLHPQVEETLSTLSYATRTKNIHNRPTVQYDPREAQISLLRREIELLRQENTLLKEQLRTGTGAGGEARSHAVWAQHVLAAVQALRARCTMCKCVTARVRCCIGACRVSAEQCADHPRWFTTPLWQAHRSAHRMPSCRRRSTCAVQLAGTKQRVHAFCPCVQHLLMHGSNTDPLMPSCRAVPPLQGHLPAGSPGSSRGNSPSPRAMLGSPSTQPGSAADAVSGLRSNSSPNMARLPGVRQGAGSPAGSPEKQLRSSINEQGACTAIASVVPCNRRAACRAASQHKEQWQSAVDICRAALPVSCRAACRPAGQRLTPRRCSQRQQPWWRGHPAGADAPAAGHPGPADKVQ